MPDKPMINKAPDELRMGASVLQEVLTLRQDAERELAEAGEVRSRALAEAADTLARATRAATDVTASAEAEATGIVEQAREQAIGIVTQAREEAALLIAEAHADAAQYEAWARQEAQAQITREFDGIRLSITDRRDDLESGLDALQSAMDRALTALDDTSSLSAAIAERHEQGEADELGGSVVSLVPVRADDDLDLDPTDDTTHDGDDAEDDETRPAETDGVEVVEVVEVDEGEVVADGVDDLHVHSTTEVTQLRSKTRKGRAQRDGAPETHGALDEDARPLGWLFRSPPGV